MTDLLLEEDLSPEFVTNPEPRCACILLLDKSGSMSGAPINALNEGLHQFKAAFAQNELTSQRVEVALISFNSQVDVVHDFTTVDQFEPTPLEACSTTNMGAGIHLALDMVAERKAQYKRNGILYYRPWIFMVTDGAPTDEWQSASERVRQDEESKRVCFFAVGVENANLNILSQISVREPVKLRGLDFGEMFLWLSESLSGISQSKVSEQVPLPPPGWAVAS